MTRRIALAVGAWLLVAPGMSAQTVEVSASAGFTSASGVTSSQASLLGQLYDEVTLGSGGSFTFTAGGFLSDRLEIEFLFSKQSSEFGVDGPAGDLALSELTLFNYHGNLVYHWGERDARMRPFVLGGFGATTDSFGDLLLPATATSTGFDGSTRFSSTWGGGVKYYFSPAIGAKLMARWTPTYIKSDPAGVWCDPFYGCWSLNDPDYANQYDFSAGITARF